jgi:hypothetical protein
MSFAVVRLQLSEDPARVSGHPPSVIRYTVRHEAPPPELVGAGSADLSRAATERTSDATLSSLLAYSGSVA